MEALKLMNADPLLTAALRHWGARSVPFTETPGASPFLSPAWEQALRLLNQTAALRSLMLLTGDNGVGKSALLAYWLERLEPKAYLPLVITHATLSGSGLLAVLLRKLGQPASLIRSRNLARLEDALKELGRVTPVLCLDESQHYPPGALEEMRLLLGLNLAPVPTFAVVLVGDTYLQDTLRLQQHKALYSRISAQCKLPLLDSAQIETYLTHGWRQVGLERPCLSAAALALLASATNGNPRLLNLLARAAWLEAAQAGANTIAPEHVQYALNVVPIAQDKINF
jgi:type II secretory pathway predicted ATPase ExeA